MKCLLSFIIIFSILFSSFSSSVIYFGYLTNQDYYAKVLCKNKATPALNCKGHCHLKKQLEQEQKKEQGTPVGSIKDKTEIVYFYQAPVFNIISSFSMSSSYASFRELATTDFPTSVFHPPSC